MRLKSAPARFKADPTQTEAGVFEAIVSVFNNVDSWGDVVLPGAFVESITAWKAGPDTLPVLWSHRMDDPTFNIGEVLDIAEFAAGMAMPDWVDPFVKANGGLWVKARIDTGPDASPVAVQALRLLKARRVTQFSYAYDEIDAGPVTVAGNDAWGLKKLRLYEVSPTQIGANELTELLAAKASVVHDGRRAARDEDRVRQASAQPDALRSLDATDDRAQVKHEEPATAKCEEPARISIPSIRLLSDLALVECEIFG